MIGLSVAFSSYNKSSLKEGLSFINFEDYKLDLSTVTGRPPMDSSLTSSTSKLLVDLVGTCCERTFVSDFHNM